MNYSQNILQKSTMVDIEHAVIMVYLVFEALYTIAYFVDHVFPSLMAFTLFFFSQLLQHRERRKSLGV